MMNETAEEKKVEVRGLFLHTVSMLLCSNEEKQALINSELFTSGLVGSIHEIHPDKFYPSSLVNALLSKISDNSLNYLSNQIGRTLYLANSMLGNTYLGGNTFLELLENWTKFFNESHKVEHYYLQRIITTKPKQITVFLHTVYPPEMMLGLINGVAELAGITACKITDLGGQTYRVKW